MAFCDSRTIAFIIYSSFLVFLADARSWDLAVTIGKEVQFFSNNGTTTGHLNIHDAIDLGGIAYDDSSRLMFLSDTRNTNLTIFTKNLAAKDFEMQTLHKRQNRTSIIGLVYDALTKNLFWTDAKEHAIVRMSVTSNETTSGEPVILLKLSEKLPRGISLDACNRRLYWANSNTSNPSIESSNLDGGDSTIVISKNLYEPLGVTVDHSTGKLYWIDDEEGVYYKIERSNLDGSNRELLVHGRHQQPYYITVDREKIYWTDWAYSAIWSINKNAKPGEIPSQWTSFHLTNPDSDPKSIVTRDNIGTIDCAHMRWDHEANAAIKTPEFANDDNDNLVTSTEDVDSIQEVSFKCLNEGIHDPAVDKCHCKPGFDGLYCERSICHNYCLHGECFVTSGGQPRCKCAPSYQGPRCEENICTGHCLNDGYCSMKNGEPFCLCKNSRGSRCEDVHDIDEICSMYCSSGLVTLRTIDTSSCRCANETEIFGITNAYGDDLRCKTMIIVFSAILGILTIVIVVLSYYVNKLRRRPRIRKRFVVSKTGITPLTSRPQLPSDQCEIMIENCCNMNICETPCFEPKLRNSETHNHKKDEKNSLLDNMDGNSC